MFRVRNCSWRSDKIPDSVSGFSPHRNEVLRRSPDSRVSLQTGFDLPLLSKCVLTSYSVAADIHWKLFSCSVHNSFMLHLIVPVRAAAEISDNVHRP